MLTVTKRDSILIAVTLGIILSVPLLAPFFYGSTTITLSDYAGDRLGHLSDVGGDHGDAASREAGSDCSQSHGFAI
jgi:hypothetical protein